MKSLVLVAIINLGVSACSVPLRLKRIDDATTAASGVRFTIMRPSYKASVAMADGEYQVILEQRLDQPVIYEATTAPNWLASTEVSMTIEDDGHLSAIMGGE